MTSIISHDLHCFSYVSSTAIQWLVNLLLYSAVVLCVAFTITLIFGPGTDSISLLILLF